MRIKILVLGLLAACASATSSGNPSESLSPDGRCVAVPGDSVFTSAAKAYRECAVTAKAVLLSTRVHPDWTPPRGSPESCFSSEIEYVVNEAGYVETASARVLRTSNKELADAATAMLPQLRYQPAMLNGTPVRQIMVNKLMVRTQVVVASARPSSASGSAPPRSAGC